MSEPETILAHAERILHGVGPLVGRRILVTGGPTRESLDPVRVITNRSSGQMGLRLAEAAWARGADVVLITGTTRFPDPVGVRVVRVDSTAQLEAAVSRELPAADALIMAAAPADYRPKRASQTKHPRSEGGLDVPFEPTADILTHTLADRKPGAVIVGFALETGDAVVKARAKLERKKLDLIVVNDALEPGAGFEVDTNHVTIISKDGSAVDVPPGSKRAVAEAILDSMEIHLGR
jgi:phosphopantothenoylcysteine decarboxylase/phosphopantothenate--cysteine ligase